MDNFNSDIKLYVITHVPCSFLRSDVIVPIATNKTLGDSLGILSSQVGDNVSDLNYLLAEFSTFYWAWKNDFTSRYLGFFHYYRYLMLNETKTYFNQFEEPAESCGFDNSFIKNIFTNYDIIVPHKQEFGMSIYNQYCMCHVQFYIDKFIEIITNKYPYMRESFLTAFSSNSGYYCNLFIMRREDFNEYMTFMFSIFEDMKPYLVQSPQIKPFAYLAERVFSGYVEYLKSIRGFRVKEVPVLYGYGTQWIPKYTTGM